MSIHNQAQNLLSAYILNELNAADQQVVASHLEQCDQCRTEAECMRSVLSIADTMGADQFSQAGQAEARGDLGRHIDTAGSIEPWWTYRVVYAIAAIVLIGILVALVFVAWHPAEDKKIADPDQQRIQELQDNSTDHQLAHDEEHRQIDAELARAKVFFDAGNVDGLAALFETASDEAKLAIVNYLAQIGTDEALQVLKSLDISEIAPAVEKVIQKAIDDLESQKEISDATAPDDLDSSNGESLNQDTESLTEKPVEANNQSAEKAGRLIKIYVTDKETDRPIEKALIESDDTLWTDQHGYAEMRWDSKKHFSLPIWVRKEGYVRMCYSVRPENSPGNDPIEIHYTMEKGTAVGGVVQNAAGEPIAGLEVTLRINDDEHRDKPENNVRERITTDANGRWEYDGVPAKPDSVNLRTQHADYAERNVWIKEAEELQQLYSKDYVIVVDGGYSISGMVRDEAGNPVKGARVQLGDYFYLQDRQHRVITDEQGFFDFKQLRIGSWGPHYEFVEGQGNVPVRRPFEYITVTADGYSPETMMLYFVEKHVELEFIMTQGDPLYGRVVDPNGQPVAGATVRADNWGLDSYDHIRSIDWNTKTDQQGRFTWEHAPSFEIQFDISQDGYMDLRTEKVKASADEYEFVLNPKVRVKVQVIDAVTKEPVQAFTFRRYEGGYISTPVLIKDSQGRLETAFAEQGETFRISFEAEGYQPTNSRSISLIEQDVELIIEMQPDAGLDGVVVDAEGKPVEGVRVLVPGSFLTIDNLKYESNWLRDIPNTVTDDQGRFHLDAVSSERYCILALEEFGYLFTGSEHLPSDGRFVLQEYGRIEGTYYKGSRPVANERIRIDYPHYHQVDKGNGVWELGPAFNYYAQTDEQGRFVFEGLIHGTARILIDPYKYIKVETGQTYEVHLGGDGLTVQGGVLNPDGEALNEDYGHCILALQSIYESLPIPESELPLPDNAEAMTYAELFEWFSEFGSSEEGRQWYDAIEQKYGDLSESYDIDINYKGQFDAPNIKPGTYLFSVIVRPWKNRDQYPRMMDYQKVLARTCSVVTVPEFETAEEMDIPVDLGTIQCRPAPLAAGMKAPDFDIPALKKPGQVRLDDYAGDTVLVNFTNPVMKVLEPEHYQQLQEACQLVQSLPNMQIINVAMELVPWPYMRERMIPECTLPGRYGIAQMYNSKIYFDYEIGTLPKSILIGPDGTVLEIIEEPAQLGEMIEKHL